MVPFNTMSMPLLLMVKPLGELTLKEMPLRGIDENHVLREKVGDDGRDRAD